MATYSELRGLFSDPNVREKTATALIVAAAGKLSGTTNERAWAWAVMQNTESWATAALKAILAANKDVPADDIQSASDSAVQTQVDAIVPHLVNVHAGA